MLSTAALTLFSGPKDVSSPADLGQIRCARLARLGLGRTEHGELCRDETQRRRSEQFPSRLIDFF
jgi:hypothetical protein